MPAPPSLLVLDSSAFVLSYLKALTARRDFARIEAVTSGAHALQYLAAGAFNACVLGTAATGDDALGLTRRIRRELPAPANRTCILVALDDPTASKVRAAVSAGADEVLLRPYTQDMLVKRITHALANRRDFVVGPHYTGPCRRRKVLGSLLHAPRRRAVDRSPRRHHTQTRNEIEVLLSCAGERITAALERLEGLSIVEVYDAASLAHHCAQCLEFPESIEAIRQLLQYLEQHGAGLDLDIATLQTRARAAAMSVARDLQGLRLPAQQAFAALNLTDSLSARAHAARAAQNLTDAPASTRAGATLTAAQGDRANAAAAQSAWLSRQVVQEHLQRRIRQD